MGGPGKEVVDREKVLNRYDPKKSAESLLSDFTEKDIDDFKYLIGQMQADTAAIQDKEVNQYRIVNKKNTANRNDDEIRMEIAVKRKEQKTDLLFASTKIFELCESLTRYLANKSHKRDDSAIEEQNLFNDIKEKSKSIQEKLKGFLTCPMFEADPEIVRKANWFAQMTETRFEESVKGSLKLDSNEVKSAEKNGTYYRMNLQQGKVIDGVKSVKQYELFSHNPSPDDIKQGGVGDCFAMASLSTIADQAPDYIRESMVDTGDSVTVRFYGIRNQQFEPVFVDVPKEIGKRFFSQQGAEGSLWTVMMEYAYAYSGLHLDPQGEIKSQEELDKFHQGKTIADMMGSLGKGGDPAVFTRALLGENVKFKDIDLLKRYKVEIKNKDDKLEKSKDERLKKELEKHIANNDVMTCCRYTLDGRTTNGPAHGVYENHAYSVVKIEGDTVTIRNPHNDNGVVNQVGDNLRNRGGLGKKIGEKLKIGGGTTTTMSIRDFREAFTQVTAGEIKDNYVEKGLDKVKENFKDVIKGLSTALKGQDNFFLRMFTNSNEFGDMKNALGDLSDTLSSKSATMDDIQKKMNDLKDKTAAYLQHTASKVKDNNRRNNRIAIAQSVQKIIGYFEKDRLVKPIDLYKADLREHIAEKIIAGIQKTTGKQVEKVKLMASPIFKDMVSDDKKLYGAAYETSPKDLTKAFQEKAAQADKLSRNAPEQPKAEGPAAMK